MLVSMYTCIVRTVWCIIDYVVTVLNVGVFQKSTKFPISNKTIVIDSSKIIGEGAYSMIYKAYDKTNKIFVLKKMYIQSLMMEKMIKTEIDSFLKFKHPNILSMIDYDINSSDGDKRVAYLLLPYMCKGSVRRVLNSRIHNGRMMVDRRPSLPYVLNEFMSICCALNVLHCYVPSFVHQDIKPENVLVDDDNTLMLTDFGSVRLANVEITSRSHALQVADEASQFCTISYKAPELFDPVKGMKLDSRTDVWSLGCLLYCLWFGHSPYEMEFNDNGTIRIVPCSYLRVLGDVPRPVNPSSDDATVLEIVDWILQKDCSVRPFTTDVLDRLKYCISKLHASCTSSFHTEV